jgi:hypothetical protein
VLEQQQPVDGPGCAVMGPLFVVLSVIRPASDR